MADKTVRIVLTGNAESALKAMAQTAAAADASAMAIGDKFEAGAGRVGNIFESLGTTLGNWGLPFSESVGRFGEKVAGMEAEGKGLQATMMEVGAVGATALAAGVAVIAAEGVHLASNFQASMEMIHTQAGASQQEVVKMSQAILDLAGPTATAPEELATALYHVESTGFRGAAALEEVKIAAEGAKVGHADLEAVTNALNAAIASGIPGVQNMGEAMGSLNAVVGAGDMKMQDLADALGTGVLAVVKGFGVNLNDVGAALATFGDNNIRGADAATALRMAVESLAKPASTGKDALKELGLTESSLGDAMKKGGLAGALTLLHDRLVATGNDGVNTGEILTEAFGKKAGVGLQVLEEQFGRFQQKQKEVADGAGTFASSWQATTQTLSFQFDALKATGEAFATKIGIVLIPVVLDLMKGLNGLAGVLEKGITPAMHAVSTAVEIVIAGFRGVDSPGTLMHGWLGTLEADLYKFGQGLDFAGRLFETVIAGFKGVDAPGSTMHGWLQTLVSDAYKLGGEFHDAFEKIKSAVEDVAGFLKAHWGTIEQVFAVFKAVVGDVVGFVVDHWKILGAAFIALSGPVAIAIAAAVELATHWHTISKDVVDVVDGMVRAIENFFAPLVGFFRDNWTAISEITGEIWNVIKGIFDLVWGEIKAIVDVAVGIVKGVIDVAWTVIRDATKTAWDVISNYIKSAWEVIKTIVEVAWNIVRGIITVGLDLLTGQWGKAWDDIKKTLDRIWGDIKSGISSAISDVLQLFGHLGSDIIHAIGDMGMLLYRVGKDVISGLIKGIEDSVGGAVDAVKNIGKSIVGGIKGLLGIHSPSTVFAEIGANIAQGLAQGMTGGTDLVAAAATSLANTAVAAAGPPAGSFLAMGTGNAGETWLTDPATGLQYNGTDDQVHKLHDLLMQIQTATQDATAAYATAVNLANGGAPAGQVASAQATAASASQWLQGLQSSASDLESKMWGRAGNGGGSSAIAGGGFVSASPADSPTGTQMADLIHATTQLSAAATQQATAIADILNRMLAELRASVAAGESTSDAARALLTAGQAEVHLLQALQGQVIGPAGVAGMIAANNLQFMHDLQSGFLTARAA